MFTAVGLVLKQHQRMFKIDAHDFADIVEARGGFPFVLLPALTDTSTHFCRYSTATLPTRRHSSWRCRGRYVYLTALHTGARCHISETLYPTTFPMRPYPRCPSPCRRAVCTVIPRSLVEPSHTCPHTPLLHLTPDALTFVIESRQATSHSLTSLRARPFTSHRPRCAHGHSLRVSLASISPPRLPDYTASIAHTRLLNTVLLACSWRPSPTTPQPSTPSRAPP